MTISGRIYAALCVPFWAILPGFGLIDLSTMFVEDSFYADVAALETSWGVLATFFAALPFGWAAARPDQVRAAAAVLWLTAAALLAAAAAGLDARPAVMAAVLVLMSLGLAWSAHRSGMPRRPAALRPDLTLLVLAVLAAPFWIAYALEALAVSRSGGSPPEHWTMGVDHWPVQGALGFTLAAAGILFALWPEPRPLLRTALSFGSVSLGVCWLISQGTGGNVDEPLLAIGAVVWGLLAALVRPAGAEPGPDTEKPRSRRAVPTPRAGSAATGTDA
jgi:hypothetical protein